MVYAHKRLPGDGSGLLLGLLLQYAPVSIRQIPLAVTRSDVKETSVQKVRGLYLDYHYAKTLCQQEVEQTGGKGIQWGIIGMK